jgi:hypothetical protein
MGVDRRPIEHEPDKWRGELDGHHIRRDGDPIPVTVKVTWSDGTEGEVNGFTSQWTHARVRRPRDSTAVSPVLGASLRRRAALTGDRC